MIRLIICWLGYHEWVNGELEEVGGDYMKIRQCWHCMRQQTIIFNPNLSIMVDLCQQDKLLTLNK